MFRISRTVPLPVAELSWSAGFRGIPVWLDIETTGFSPHSSQVTLIGWVLPFPHGRRLEQVFADTPEDEVALLRLAVLPLHRAGTVITFNGERFDLPFLAQRALAHGVQMPRFAHRDLLLDAHAWDPEGRLVPDHRLQTLMRHFGLQRADASSGQEMVLAYRRWLRHRAERDRQFILDHNADDLLRLPELTMHLVRDLRGA